MDESSAQPQFPEPTPVEKPPQVALVSPTPKINWLISLLFLVIGIAVGATGLWSYQNYLPATIQTSPTPPTSMPADNNILSMTGSLQDFMKANCKSGNPQYLEFSKLPVEINTGIIKVDNKKQPVVYCSSTEDNTKPIKDGYLVINLENNQTINIYDDQSKELGHGGAPFIGFFGQKIFEEGNIQIGAWLQGGDGPQVLGDIGVVIRGVKKFSTKDGYAVYVNHTKGAIPGSDTRLIDQLKPYSSIDPDLELETVKFDPTTSVKIVDFFFSETPGATSPEGIVLQNIKDIMSAITAK